MLGGAQLYGRRPWVALRELIQNAADAIRVRRCLAGDGAWGRIRVSLRKETYGTWLDVLDNGIGMRTAVPTGKLLGASTVAIRRSSIPACAISMRSKGSR